MNGEESLVVVPEATDLREINKFHDDVGHPGINATVKGIQQRYFWRGMYNEISEYVSFSSQYVNCLICCVIISNTGQIM